MTDLDASRVMVELTHVQALGLVCVICNRDFVLAPVATVPEPLHDLESCSQRSKDAPADAKNEPAWAL